MYDSMCRGYRYKMYVEHRQPGVNINNLVRISVDIPYTTTSTGGRQCPQTTSHPGRMCKGHQRNSHIPP
jgi:hypothetical protein